MLLSVCLPSLSHSVYTTHCYRRTLTALLASHRPTRSTSSCAAATAKATTKYTTTIVNRSSNSLCKANRVAVNVVVVAKGVAVVVVLKRMLLPLALNYVCVRVLCECVLYIWSLFNFC